MNFRLNFTNSACNSTTFNSYTMSTVTSPHNNATAATTQPIQQGGGTEPGEVALPTRWEVELEVRFSFCVSTELE